MYLIDTNIFLEVLMSQDNSEKCKIFLEENYDNLYMSDFTLHSIGVILFRNKKSELFKSFATDVLPNINILSLKKERYNILHETHNISKLDFDDAYQYQIAREYELTIVTMDADFKKLTKEINLIFL